MCTGTEAYPYTDLYLALSVLYQECRWWQFIRKGIIRGEIHWVYPLMLREREGLKS
jgi:hypothetical protein